MRLKITVSTFCLRIIFLRADFLEDCGDFGNSEFCLVRKKLSQKIYSASEQFQELKKLID